MQSTYIVCHGNLCSVVRMRSRQNMHIVTTSVVGDSDDDCDGGNNNAHHLMGSWNMESIFLAKQEHTLSRSLQPFHTKLFALQCCVFHPSAFPSMIFDLKRLFTFWFVHFFSRLLRDYLLKHEPSFRYRLSCCLLGWLAGWCVRLFHSLLCSQYRHIHTDTRAWTTDIKWKMHEIQWKFYEYFTAVPFFRIFHPNANNTEHTAFNYNNECFIPRNKQM